MNQIQDKKTILLCLPHCSSGGLPNYTYKTIRSLIDVFECYVLEWQNLSDEYVIHKNKIKDLLGPHRFFTLKENKNDIFDIISQISPDIIHFCEIPEYFISHDISEKLFNKNRKYKTIFTTHSSDFDIKNVIWKPDKYLFVSPWSSIQYSNLDVDYEVIKFPIDRLNITEEDKLETKKQLNLDLNKKEVLVLGLWTERKSQGTVVDLARKLIGYPIHFNFVGNAAPNFAYYHQKYLNNLPSNCTFWGEKNPDLFLKAADLQIFASKGKVGDMELRPLVISESITYNVPILLNNLDVYLNEYDNNPLVHYLTGNPDQDCQKILKILDINQINTNIVINNILDNFIFTSFDKTTNKISIVSLYTNKLDFSACSVKELDSEIPMYFWEHITLWPGSEIWTVPISNYDFDADKFCGGFILEFYDYNQIVVLRKTIRLNPPVENKPKIPHLNPFDCLYINYREFFCAGIYNSLDFGNLDTVIDIGANVGLFSQFIRTKGALKVISVEPNPKCFLSLKNNIFEGQILENVAIAGHNGEIDFFIPDNNSTVGSIYDSNTLKDFGSMKKIKVPCVTLETLIEKHNLNKINLVKIDCESAEYLIMQTLSNDVFKRVDKWLIEFHNNYNNEIKTITDKFDRNELKYEIYEG